MKTCVTCKREFDRPKGCSYSLWEKRKLCSMACRIKWSIENKIGFKVGHPGYKNKTSFLKGNKPWNRGLIGRMPWHNTTGLVAAPLKGKRMSISSRQKMSRANLGKPNLLTRGEKHWNWKGGTTELRKQIMQTAMYRLWRQCVYERDNWSCTECGIRGGKLQADHIKTYAKIIAENSIKTVQDAKRCPELWEVSNGRTLCVACHLKTDTWGNRSAKIDL